eukprot:TRINITY_DN10663_c0_g1_i7.p1 TRINITY_DN10663_c0_g1~~TRINITY_DN10663_c0_g1_i7.p1  ORF type:complete len:189 (-),score=13.78 TRINITY_DN10663_c0_g1_i7:283-849(-)
MLQVQASASSETEKNGSTEVGQYHRLGARRPQIHTTGNSHFLVFWRGKHFCDDLIEISKRKTTWTESCSVSTMHDIPELALDESFPSLPSSGAIPCSPELFPSLPGSVPTLSSPSACSDAFSKYEDKQFGFKDKSFFKKLKTFQKASWKRPQSNPWEKESLLSVVLANWLPDQTKDVHVRSYNPATAQ